MKTITIQMQDFAIHVSGYVTDGEPEIIYPVDSANPGSGPEFDIQDVELEGDLFLFLQSGLTQTDIINLAYEYL